MDKETIQDAIIRLFSPSMIKRELPTNQVREFLAEYLGKKLEEIPLDIMLEALRETDFALPRPKLRGSSKLAWVFVARPNKTQVKKPPKKPRNVKNKSPTTSLRLKPS